VVSVSRLSITIEVLILYGFKYPLNYRERSNLHFRNTFYKPFDFTSKVNLSFCEETASKFSVINRLTKKPDTQLLKLLKLKTNL